VSTFDKSEFQKYTFTYTCYQRVRLRLHQSGNAIYTLCSPRLSQETPGANGEKYMKTRLTLPLVLLALLVVAPFANGQKLKAEEIIAKHLDSIGTAEKRASLKTFIAVGEVRVEFITQKNQPASGRLVVASDGSKSFLGMSLNDAKYPHEKVIFDGNKTAVALVYAGNRSVLGNFIQSNSSIVSSGIFGGTLSNTWILLSPDQRKAKVSTSGSKKIDGRDAYGIDINPKGGGDLEITLYFDKETFRHVRTEYSRTSSAAMGRTIDESARQSETRIKVTEDFSDFKDYQGIMVPNKYRILYSIAGSSTTEVSWTADLAEFAINQALDASTFDAGK
jgi:outer membrane lipoprotein-sorting protein